MNTFAKYREIQLVWLIEFYNSSNQKYNIFYCDISSATSHRVAPTTESET